MCGSWRGTLIRLIAGFLAFASGATSAIGWDSDDFLIASTIGNNQGLSNRIGVYNFDLTFKGYLDSSFGTAEGLDFDAAGQFVGVGWTQQEVRVYNSAGSKIGGFIKSDNSLGTAGDLKVTADGTYIIATSDQLGGDGTRQFGPQGALLHQLGSGHISAAAVLPGNILWAGGRFSNTVNVFDLVSGAQVG